MSDQPRPKSESIVVAGPAGALEGLLDLPVCADIEEVAVICHPHPSFGGTMTNKVVHTLAKAFVELGIAAVRFNYRGVGASAGSYDEGRGETEDAVAVMDWARLRWPGATQVLGGFSFGGGIAIRVAARREVVRLVTISPAIRLVSVDDVPPPRCAWLIIQGDRDELVDAQDIESWVRTLDVKPQLTMLAGAEHFFHGRLNDVREAVIDWVRDEGDRR